MQVQEFMTQNIDVVGPDMSIREVARMMRDENVGAYPIGENDRLIGMITDRDIAVRGVADDRPAGGTSARDVMSDDVCYCFDDDDETRAAELMANHQVHRLPVLNRDKRLVGIVALADLARADSDAVRTAVSGISQPTGKSRS